MASCPMDDTPPITMSAAFRRTGDTGFLTCYRFAKHLATRQKVALERGAILL
jgi:hypothetical protein